MTSSTLSTAPTPRAAADVLLAAHHVDKFYGDDRTPVLEQISASSCAAKENSSRCSAHLAPENRLCYASSLG